jgi:hypothetical protein
MPNVLVKVTAHPCKRIFQLRLSEAASTDGPNQPLRADIPIAAGRIDAAAAARQRLDQLLHEMGPVHFVHDGACHFVPLIALLFSIAFALLFSIGTIAK